VIIQVIRVVIDTNILLSALVFNSGKLLRFRQLWQEQQFQPLVSKLTVMELLRVLAYPKFKLTPIDREELLADYLTFCETVQMPIELPQIPPCRDPADEPFLYLALVGAADYLVTGDSQTERLCQQDLLSLADVFNCPIVTATNFLEMFS
jgi:uncharacterized protein